MAQQVTFIWMAVVEEHDDLHRDRPNHLVRPAYRAAPIGTEVHVVRRDSRKDEGAARFTAVWTAPAGELASRFGEMLSDVQRGELERCGDELATLLRFEMV